MAQIKKTSSQPLRGYYLVTTKRSVLKCKELMSGKFLHVNNQSLTQTRVTSCHRNQPHAAQHLDCQG